jgi:membrane-associated phospholipid phosphatase
MPPTQQHQTNKTFKMRPEFHSNDNKRNEIGTSLVSSIFNLFEQLQLHHQTQGSQQENNTTIEHHIKVPNLSRLFVQWFIPVASIHHISYQLLTTKQTIQQVLRKHWQFCIGVLYFCGCVVFNSICQVYAQRIADIHFDIDKYKVEHLPDLGFVLLPHVNSPQLSDHCLTFMYLLSLIQVVNMSRSSRWNLDRKMRVVQALKRLALIHGSVFIFRGICIVMTMLPNPSPNCQKRITHENVFVSALLIGMGQNFTCADTFFSGHAVAFTLLALFWNRYLTCTWITIIVVYPMTLIGILSLIATHFHYTSDVFFGIVISVSAWLFYHRIFIKTMESSIVYQLLESNEELDK